MATNFADKLRAALSGSDSTGLPAQVAVNVEKMPARKPAIARVLYEGDKIVGLVYEPLEAVVRDRSGEITHVMPEGGA